MCSNFTVQERKSEEKRCSGKCKRIVRKIVEQVRAEMEQWTLMQEMLESVKQEMEELQSSRDFWQDRALDSEDQLQSLLSSVRYLLQLTSRPFEFIYTLLSLLITESVLGGCFRSKSGNRKLSTVRRS